MSNLHVAVYSFGGKEGDGGVKNMFLQLCVCAAAILHRERERERQSSTHQREESGPTYLGTTLAQIRGHHEGAMEGEDGQELQR